MRRPNATFKWRLGGTGDEVTFTTTAPSGDYLRDLYDRIERMNPGEHRSQAIRELTVVMDLFATFHGEFVEDDGPPEDPTPAYLAQGAFSATESLFPVPSEPGVAPGAESGSEGLTANGLTPA